MTKYITLPCNECGQPKRVINGQWLKEIRENANLTQREFGRIVGLSSPYISDIERNRRICPAYVFECYLELRK